MRLCEREYALDRANDPEIPYADFGCPVLKPIANLVGLSAVSESLFAFSRKRSMKKYKVGNVVDLDDVVSSAAALAAWSAVAEKAAALCVALGVPREQWPEEQARLNADGSLTIWVDVPAPSGGSASLEMRVPPGQWQWRQ